MAYVTTPSSSTIKVDHTTKAPAGPASTPTSSQTPTLSREIPKLSSNNSNNSDSRSQERFAKPSKKKFREKSSTEVVTSRPAADLCSWCKKNPQCWSVRIKDYIKLCEECSEKKKSGNRSSYHKRHSDTHKTIALETQIASSQEKLFSAQADCGAMRERLAVSQKRYDALQESFENSQKMLAAALDSANNKGGKAGGKELPSAISVRNESIVVQRLQEITEILVDRRSKAAGQEAAILSSLQDERRQYTLLFEHTVETLERLAEKLVR
jgi:hypothetical protein